MNLCDKKKTWKKIKKKRKDNFNRKKTKMEKPKWKKGEATYTLRIIAKIPAYA